MQPYRNRDEATTNEFYGLFTTYPHWIWVDLSAEIADTAARFRADYRRGTPDAILLATAIRAGATGFIGNDSQIRRGVEIDALLVGR